MRKAEEHLSMQRHYEEENEAKLKEARQKRQQERELQQSLEVRDSLISDDNRIVFMAHDRGLEKRKFDGRQKFLLRNVGKLESKHKHGL